MEGYYDGTYEYQPPGNVEESEYGTFGIETVEVVGPTVAGEHTGSSRFAGRKAPSSSYPGAGAGILSSPPPPQSQPQQHHHHNHHGRHGRKRSRDRDRDRDRGRGANGPVKSTAPTSSFISGVPSLSVPLEDTYSIPPEAPLLYVPADLPLSDVVLLDAVATAVMRGGPSVEEEVARREENNPHFEFLQAEWNDPRLLYYRWRLYSLLQGDSLTSWRTEPFQIERGPNACVWVPPPALLVGPESLRRAGACSSPAVSPVGVEAPPASTAPSYPCPSAFWIARKVAMDRRLFAVMDPTDEQLWVQQIRMTKADLPVYTPVCRRAGSATAAATTTSANSGSSPASSDVVSEEGLNANWLAWCEQWKSKWFQPDHFSSRMVFAVEHYRAPHHLLSLLLDEVVRLAYDNSARTNAVMDQPCVFTPLAVVETECVSVATHCLQLQWYLFVLHDIMMNLSEKPLLDDDAVAAMIEKEDKEEAERQRKAQEEEERRRNAAKGGNGGKRGGGSSGGATLLSELGFTLPQPPMSEAAKAAKAAAEAAAALAASEQRRLWGNWVSALEMVLPTLIEAIVLVVLNTLHLAGGVQAQLLNTGLAAELGRGVLTTTTDDDDRQVRIELGIAKEVAPSPAQTGLLNPGTPHERAMAGVIKERTAEMALLLFAWLRELFASRWMKRQPTSRLPAAGQAGGRADNASRGVLPTRMSAKLCDRYPFLKV